MRRLFLAFAMSLVALGCEETTSSDDDADGSGASGGQGGQAVGGAGGMGGDGGQGGLPEYVPTAEDIGFMAAATIPAGEQILFNDWSLPDRVRTMAPDGSNAADIFSVYRVWSMGVSRAGDRIAFSCGDPNQELHYGINVGDAIQHTWLYDMETESVELLAYGNINDECHHFGPGDTELHLCRRYDFDAQGMGHTYRLGAITLSDNTFAFTTADSATILDLYPQVSNDGTTLYFGRINGGTRTIQSMTLPSGSPSQLRATAGSPVLSPNGLRYLYADTSDMSSLYASDLDGQNVVLVADFPGTSARYSPDGSQVAYLLWDDAAVCSHVEVVAADGSQATTPTRIRDCSTTGEFITELAWFIR